MTMLSRVQCAVLVALALGALPPACHGRDSRLARSRDWGQLQVSRDLRHVSSALGHSQPVVRSRSYGNTGRNFVTRLMEELNRLARVGLSWFAPEPEVAPLECTATNGALDTGTCHSDASCTGSGGVASGTCNTGGVCCIFPTVCGGIVSRNRTWFVNKDFPDYSRDPTDCHLTIKRIDPKVRQVRLDLVIAELGDAVQGRCQRDSLTVRQANSDTNLLPPLCGDNSGQHVYVDFGYQDVQLVLKMTDTQRRKWHILVSQVSPGHEVPSGCLQYYSDRAATVKSLNYNSGSYLFKGTLDYDICFAPINEGDREAGCERTASDLNLRQADNDITTRRHREVLRPRRGRRFADLPLVMNFKEDNARIRRMNRRRPSRSRSMEQSYSIARDPVYSQIDQVLSQLRNPTSSSGLESLLKSKSQLDAMGEDFGEKNDKNDDSYYYYYYDDPSFYSNNDLIEGDDKRVTDNYAVEHTHREYIVLPDGSPVPSSFFSKNRNTIEQEQLLSKLNGEKYFHTGMLEDITLEYPKEILTESEYPTPTWYQRPTTTKVNLLKPSLPVASIMVFDPMTHITDEQLVYADPYTKETKPIHSDSPTQFTFSDLSTLSSISPDDEYNLKHDGAQWVFLRNDESNLDSPTSDSRLKLPHGITLSTESITGNRPHLIFKHPSGTITEMHINPGTSGNSKEKIITVIETGPVTQNFTKIKINDISELDKVIENVFDIINDNSQSPDVPVLQTTSSKQYPKTTYSNTYASTPTNFKTSDTTFYTSLRPEDLEMTTADGIDENFLTTLYNTRVTGKPVSDATRVTIHRVPRPTTTPGGVTRFVTRPKVTKFSTRPSPESIRLTTSQYQSTTPSSAATRFSSYRPSSTVRYTPMRPSQLPNINRSPHTTNSPAAGTAVPTRLYTMISQGNTNFLSQTQPTETVETVRSTVPTVVMQTTVADDPFTEMLSSIGIEAITPEPLFTISTTSNGKTTTKTYTTVNEAMADLGKITAVTGGSSSTIPDGLRFTTLPLSSASAIEPTQNPFGETTISEDLKKLITNSDNADVAYFNNDVCGDSFIKLNHFKMCDHLLRSDVIRDEAIDLFNNIERISVRSVSDGSSGPLRFSVSYATECPATVTTPTSIRATAGTRGSTTTTAPQVKTINLLQYLLGWYR